MSFTLLSVAKLRIDFFNRNHNGWEVKGSVGDNDLLQYQGSTQNLQSSSSVEV